MKRNLHSTLLAAAVGAGMMLAAGTASAGAIVAPSPSWYTFQFGATGTGATAGPCSITTFSGCAPLDDPPWTFDLESWRTFSITDAFLYGDEFEVFDFGVSILSTPVVGEGGTCGDNPEVCFADPLSSSASVGLAPGAHSLTIVVTDSPFGAGGAFFRVPEPATLTLFGFGLVALGFMMRRRRRTV